MSATDFEAAAKAANAEFESVRAEYNSFMAPIQPKIDAFHILMRDASKNASLELSELFAKVTYADLVDPLTALAVYEIGYNSGAGIPNEGKHLASLFPDSYVLRNSEWYPSADYKTAVLCLQIGIPAKADDAKLKRTAELLAPVYETAASISDDAKIGILDDGLNSYESYKIVKEDGLWILMGGYREIFSHEDLVTVLKRVPTYE